MEKKSSVGVNTPSMPQRSEDWRNSSLTPATAGLLNGGRIPSKLVSSTDYFDLVGKDQ